MVEDQLRRECRARADALLQLGSKLDSAEGVDARFHQRRIRVHGVARCALHRVEHRTAQVVQYAGERYGVRLRAHRWSSDDSS